LSHPYHLIRSFLLYVYYLSMCRANDNPPSRLSEACLKRRRERTSKRRHRFIKGPLPLVWFSQAATLSGKACNVALAIWYKAGLSKTSSDLRITPDLLSQFGVSVRTGRVVFQAKWHRV
jgi:hypothetical protein